MVIYNVTVGVDTDVEQEWLKWMIEEHAPKVIQTGYFKDFEIFKVLSHQDEGSSYSIQYKAENVEQVEQYLEEAAPVLIKEHMERYKDKHVAFRTLLQKIV